MKHVFKEGDGSHQDMTIGQCNLVLDRLRAQGYKVEIGECDDIYKHFWFKQDHFQTTPTVRSIISHSHNQIHFSEWMRILDENGKDPLWTLGAGDDYPVTDYAELNRLAAEAHPKTKSGIIYEHLSKEAKLEYLIEELRDAVDRIPEFKLAGEAERMRKIAVKIVNLC